MIVWANVVKCGMEGKDKPKRKEVIEFVDCSCSCRFRVVRAIEYLKMKEEAKIT